MELDYRCISLKTFSFWKGLRVMVPGKVLTALNLSVSGQGFIYIRSAWGKGREASTCILGSHRHFTLPNQKPRAAARLPLPDDLSGLPVTRWRRAMLKPFQSWAKNNQGRKGLPTLDSWGTKVRGAHEWRWLEMTVLVPAGLESLATSPHSPGPDEWGFGGLLLSFAIKLILWWLQFHFWNFLILLGSLLFFNC